MSEISPEHLSLNVHCEAITMSDSETPLSPTSENASLNIHRGAIDQRTVITTREPKQVMERMGKHLQKMGMHVTQKGGFLYRCSTLKKEGSSAVDEQPPEVSPPEDVVRFTVELTLLDGLKDTYSLDIRRLRGSLRRYKHIYDEIRRDLAPGCTCADPINACTHLHSQLIDEPLSHPDPLTPLVLLRR